MHFDEKKIGDYRIYAGALEAPQGDGYIAALIIHREGVRDTTPREIMRDESLACGHRWPSYGAALAYALGKGTDAVRKQSFISAPASAAAADRCDCSPTR